MAHTHGREGQGCPVHEEVVTGPPFPSSSRASCADVLAGLLQGTGRVQATQAQEGQGVGEGGGWREEGPCLSMHEGCEGPGPLPPPTPPPSPPGLCVGKRVEQEETVWGLGREGGREEGAERGVRLVWCWDVRCGGGG